MIRRLDPAVRDLNRRILKDNGGHMPGTLNAILSRRDDFETPPALFARYHRKFTFNLDPCANAHNKMCDAFITKEENGLRVKWGNVLRDPVTAWMHPPHSDAGLWARKAAIEGARPGVTVVGLLPALTSSDWWHEFVIARALHVQFLRGVPAFRLGRLPAQTRGRPLPLDGFAVVMWMSGAPQ